MKFITSILYLFFALYDKDYFKKHDQGVKRNLLIEGLKIETDTQGYKGRKNEPISFIVFAKNDKDFETFLGKTQWFGADPVTFLNSIKGMIFNFLNLPYDTFQLTPYFWQGKTQDYNIQKPTEKHTIRQRHHARFWKSGMKTKSGLFLYVGMSSYDTGMERLLAHTIDPDLDKEREYLFEAFKKTKMIKEFKKISIHNQRISGSDFMGDEFFSDGKAYLLYI